MTDHEDKTETPDPFATLHEQEVQVVPPDYSLKRIIGEDADIKLIFNADSIAKAQEAINAHKDSFLEWVIKDIAQLNQLYAAAKSDPSACETDIRKLAKIAFVIKSQAGTFGYQLATQVAKSLDDFCSQNFQPTPDHMLVVEKHIETLTVIFDKNIVGDGGPLGKELIEKLAMLIGKYKKG